MHNLNSDFCFSGLSGLQLQIPQSQYPAPFETASRLTYYSSLFNSIEFNSSFYKIPRDKTVAKWVSLVSDTFKFTFKLWKGISHVKGLHFNEEDVLVFFDSINAVQNKSGCVLIQLPPSSSINSIENLDKLLSYIRKVDPLRSWNIAVEFRNKTWYHETVFNLLDHHDAAVVIHDIPSSNTPLIVQRVGFIYLRFHGPTGNYRDSYSDDFLHEYAQYIKEWMQEGKTVFVYFNNTMGNAIGNLKFLNTLLHEKQLK